MMRGTEIETSVPARNCEPTRSGLYGLSQSPWLVWKLLYIRLVIINLPVEMWNA